MALYCEKSDVLTVAKAFGPDIRRDTLSDEQLDSVIAEASDVVAHMLLSRYDLSNINSNIPPGVRNLTKIKATLLLFDRYVPNPVAAEGRVSVLQKEANVWEKQIVTGSLLYTDGTSVPSKNGPGIFYQTGTIRTAVDDLYQFGARGWA